MYPASMDGVISVSAVDPNREKAIYSNSGPYVDVAAPGGSACGCPTGDVWSTWADESTGAFDYQFLNGTSMASPHVAGVIALMKSVNAALTPQDIDDLLMGSHPLLPGVQITSDLGVPGRDDVFGSGLIDAFKAVTAAQALKGQVISGSRASATL